MFLSAWTVVLAAPIIGSWLGVLVRRWPHGRPVVVARSSCDHCGHSLGAFDLVPIASYALLRGRCRYCGEPIGRFHLLIELAAMTIAAATVYADGDGLKTWIDAALGWALLCAAWIDAETFRLPDIITLPLILAGLAVTWVYQPDNIFNHAAAAALGYVGFRLLNGVYHALRHRQGLGVGDAKLLAAAGAWLGIAVLPYVVTGAGILGICFAALLGSPIGPRREQIVAFGPALALSFFLLELFGHFAA